MRHLEPVNRFWRWLKVRVWTLVDVLPPYSKVEGLLEAKETDPRGKFYISVGSIWVEVDRTTFGILVIGENLRVRHTKSMRAINIDRLLPPTNPG